MSETGMTVYGKDVAATDFKFEDYKKLMQLNGNAYAILECFHENLFCELSDAPDDAGQFLVSARLFCKEKNIRIRRLDDSLFRIAADFPIDDFWQSVWTKTLTLRETRIILWGYVNQGIKDYLYEEKIPHLFSYPGKIPVSNDRDRLSLVVCEYLDGHGNIQWSRFVRIEKWNQTSGLKVKEETT